MLLRGMDVGHGALGTEGHISLFSEASGSVHCCYFCCFYLRKLSGVMSLLV